MQYKTVPGPIGLTISKNGSYEEAVNQYAGILNHEAAGGWRLVQIQEIPVVEDRGCMAGCLASIGIGSRYNERTFNMLVFERDSTVGGQPGYGDPIQAGYGMNQSNNMTGR